MTLVEIKRRVKPGQVYSITNHREPDLAPLAAAEYRKRLAEAAAEAAGGAS